MKLLLKRKHPFRDRNGRLRMGLSWFSLCVMLCGCATIRPSVEIAVYQNDFEATPLGRLPEEFLVLNGEEFAVKEEASNRFLELPGTPLDAFGLLLGPPQKDDSSISARIFGTSQGRRLPAFGVGLNGATGFKLQVAPAKAAVEIERDGSVQKSVPYVWKSGQWTHFQLQVRRVGSGVWRVSGKVWNEGDPQPAAPTIEWETKEEPANFRASIWGSPFSGTPIRFDDLRVARITTTNQ